MDFNKSDFSILECLIKNECTTPIQSLTIQQLAKHTNLSIPKVRLVVKAFLMLNYINSGAKDGISKTYFILPTGTDFYHSAIGYKNNGIESENKGE